MVNKKRYRMYIDESGDHTVPVDTKPSTIYLGLTGVVISCDDCYETLRNKMEEIKKETFPDHAINPVVFHREALISKEKSFSVLKNDFIRKAFDEKIQKLYQLQNYKLICSVIDKRHHIEYYRDKAFDPYIYSFMLVLERYCTFLEINDGIGDVMAECRGTNEDTELKNEYHRFYNFGTFYRTPTLIQRLFTTNELKVKKKEINICGLQLADLLAHTTKEDILIRNKVIPNDWTEFDKTLAENVKYKYFRKDGKCAGFGRIYIKR
jgi:hypothetical protein